MDPEFVEGDRATKLKLLAFIAVVVLLVLVDILTSPDDASRVADPALALKKSVDRLLLVALVAAPLAAGAAIYLLRLGVGVARSGRYPPPGVSVAVRTKVCRGRRARWNAMLIFVLAAVVTVAGAAPLYAWYSVARLAARLGMR